ncbi:putative branched chain amino acid ABC transporter permease component precursor [Bradyrhizobium sp. ORS 375]|uniref:branched-chain amino acid ABC transporter permease n=1 Tax=Bradyrhizobium sp. (strain ORS 375) TaxID=566679 RepID=UPI0002408099|nr:branched-chain amino acid ABC transporter permease [Bradyrhizobium sp. ORS 375]CCD96075.1 putative branched chain amino acid ABC transporter permease component precursor [Bradyrhizobium sp. ORS 375]
MSVLTTSVPERSLLLHHPFVRVALSGISFAALLAAPSFLPAYFVEIGFKLLLYIVLAEAWNLLAGYCGLVSLGSSSFFGLGAYVTVGLLNHTGSGIGLALAASALVAMTLALAMSRGLFRLRGLYFTVGTLALAEALRLLVVNVPWFGGATGLFVSADLPDVTELFRDAALLLVVASLVMTLATGSRFSVLLRAVRDDEDAASQVGVRAFRVKLAAFMVASALIAIAGGLQAIKLGAIEPYGSFGLQWSVDPLAIVIIGGLGMRFGAIVGAIFFVAIGELLADYPELHVAITGIILIILIRCAPRGLCGLLETALRRTGPTKVASS